MSREIFNDSSTQVVIVLEIAILHKIIIISICGDNF